MILAQLYDDLNSAQFLLEPLLGIRVANIPPHHTRPTTPLSPPTPTPTPPTRGTNSTIIGNKERHCPLYPSPPAPITGHPYVI